MWKHVLYDKIEVTVEQDRQVSIIDNQVSSMRFSTDTIVKALIFFTDTMI